MRVVAHLIDRLTPDDLLQFLQGGLERIYSRYTWKIYAERLMTLSRVYRSVHLGRAAGTGVDLGGILIASVCRFPLRGDSLIDCSRSRESSTFHRIPSASASVRQDVRLFLSLCCCAGSLTPCLSPLFLPTSLPLCHFLCDQEVWC